MRIQFSKHAKERYNQRFPGRDLSDCYQRIIKHASGKEVDEVFSVRTAEVEFRCKREDDEKVLIVTLLNRGKSLREKDRENNKRREDQWNEWLRWRPGG